MQERAISTVTLYDLLTEPAPLGSTSGQTNITKAKETVDADAETLAFEDLIYGR